MQDDQVSHHGADRLTARQSACVALVAEGMSSKEIARELGISPSTVDNHIASAMNAAGFSSRAAIARWYRAYRESDMPAEGSDTDEADPKSNPESYIRFEVPTLGGSRNELSLKERLIAIAQVVIVSTMVASAASLLVLGLIFFMNLPR